MRFSFRPSLGLKFVGIILVLALLFMIDLVTRKLAIEKETTRLMVSILDSWKQGDLTTHLPKWEDPQQAPPISNLMGYAITGVRFFNHEKKTARAEFSVRLDFVDGELWPTGKEWQFTLAKKTLGGWSVVDFKLKE